MDRAKISIEYLVVGDGRKLVNYWDFRYGNDVCCEVVDGKLLKSEYDQLGNEMPAKEISFQDFLNLIEERN
jgi:hypothetical protein